MSLDQKIFNYITASLAIIANMVTIYIAFEDLGSFFATSAKGILTLLLIMLLPIIVLYFLNLCRNTTLLYFFPFWGIFYVSISCLLFQIHAYYFLQYEMTFTLFINLLFSTFLIGSLGIYQLNIFKLEFTMRLSSYILGVNSMYYAFVFSSKYIYQNMDAQIHQFTGELFFLFYSSIVFIILFLWSKNSFDH